MDSGDVIAFSVKNTSPSSCTAELYNNSLVINTDDLWKCIDKEPSPFWFEKGNPEEEDWSLAEINGNNSISDPDNVFLVGVSQTAKRFWLNSTTSLWCKLRIPSNIPTLTSDQKDIALIWIVLSVLPIMNATSILVSANVFCLLLGTTLIVRIMVHLWRKKLIPSYSHLGFVTLHSFSWPSQRSQRD